METIRIKEITNLVDIFCTHVRSLDSISRVDTNDIFQAKIQSLGNNIPDNPLYMQALSRLGAFDFSSVLQSPCHGDLTLENILIDTTNQIYLIDFLDSFFDSWMIDVAKLLQDLELEWSYRHQEISPNLKLRLLVAKEALLEQIQSMPNGNNNIINIYNILLLNVMRIVPYAKDDETRQWIDNAINKITQILISKGE